MKLPGISAAIADKIVAHRPYNSKARLVTEKIITIEGYEKLTHLVIAKQNECCLIGESARFCGRLKLPDIRAV